MIAGTPSGEPVPGPAEERSSPVTAPAAERWLRRNADRLALGFAVFVFALRVFSMRGTHLSADEALDFQIANLPGFGDVYRSSLTIAHPPLFFLILRSWLFFGKSELFLRLVPAFFGAAFLWAAYCWIRALLGKGAAFLGLVLLVLSPALWSLSGEIRSYTLLLFLMAASLALLEAAINARSARLMVLFSFALFLAILTHFAALWPFLAAALYALARFRDDPPPRRVVGVWAGFQGGAVLLFLYLYVTHVAKIRGSAFERGAITRWLRAEYFQPDQDHLVAFGLRQTGALFQFLFSLPALAVLAGAAAAGGVAYLAARKRPAVLLLVLPLLFGMGAAVLDLYPYGATRHSVYLLPFVAAAAGALGGAVTAGRLWPAVLAAGMLLPLSFWTLPVSRGQDLGGMTAAIARLRSAAPLGSVLFADEQTFLLLSYYLGREGFTHRAPRPQGYWEDDAAGYRIVGSSIWIFSRAGLPRELDRFIRFYGLRRGQNLWIVQARPDYDPAAVLSRSFAGITFPFVSGPGSLSIVEAKLP
jgi:hypothetical protein